MKFIPKNIRGLLTGALVLTFALTAQGISAEAYTAYYNGQAYTPYTYTTNYTATNYTKYTQPSSTTPAPSSTSNTTKPTTQPSTNNTVPSSQTVSGVSVVDEQTMVNLVNKERAAAGLKPLTVDAKLTELARLKAKDMIDKNYFGHTSPTYGSPFDMLKNNGVTYRYAGENLAGAPNVNTAHTNLMNSASHKANILKPEYTKVGIGVVNGGPYGKMFVQLFIG